MRQDVCRITIREDDGDTHRCAGSKEVYLNEQEASKNRWTDT